MRRAHASPQPVALAAVAMSSGAALVVFVVTRVSLGLLLLCGAVCILALAVYTWRRLTPAARPIVVERLRTGLMAGIPATAAYDLARFVLVKAAGLTIWPFDTFPLFGQAILGGGLPPSVTLAAGVAYHYVNGMSFAVAYALLFRRRLFVFGIAWAIVLEIAMLLVYPHWLPNLGKVIGEFTLVSLTGHVAFGTTLGAIVQWAPSAQPRPRARAA